MHTHHAQIYHYHIDTGIAHNPLAFRTAMHCPKPLDIASMRAGAALLTGVHDFTQFSNNAPERLRRNPVKDVWRFDIIETEGGLRLEVEGSGFLYKQVGLAACSRQRRLPCCNSCAANCALQPVRCAR